MKHFLAQVTSGDIEIPKANLTQGSVESALQIAFGLGGAIALIIITIAGLRYVVSAGDPASATKARNAIIYALIGLVVCLTAFSIITFVLGRL